MIARSTCMYWIFPGEIIPCAVQYGACFYSSTTQSESFGVKKATSVEYMEQFAAGCVARIKKKPYLQRT